MSEELANISCEPCSGDVPPLEGEELKTYEQKLSSDWEVMEGHHLTRSYSFPDFRTALEFTNQVGELAEDMNHHPDITLTWGEVQITIWTHEIDGLSEIDFVFAARAEQLFDEREDG